MKNGIAKKVIIAIVCALVVVGTIIIVSTYVGTGDGNVVDTTENSSEVKSEESKEEKKKEEEKEVSKLVYSECAKAGNKCTDEELKQGQVVKVKVNDTESYDFLVLKDDGQKLTLFTFKEFGISTWLSEEDVKNVFGYDRNATEDKREYFGTYGPYTMQKAINEVTANWNNIPVLQYIYESETYTKTPQYGKVGVYQKMEWKDGIATITDFFGKETQVPGQAKGRLITFDEYDNIMGTAFTNNYNIFKHFDNLGTLYFTSLRTPSAPYCSMVEIYLFEIDGREYRVNSFSGTVNAWDDPSFGIRFVIDVDKSNI